MFAEGEENKFKLRKSSMENYFGTFFFFFFLIDSYYSCIKTSFLHLLLEH